MIFRLTALLFACDPKTANEGTDTAVSAAQDSSESESGATSVEPVLFPAADVSDASIETTLFWFDVADRAWFTQDSYGWDRFNPVYLAMAGDDMQSTIDMEQEYCAYLQEYHPQSVEYSRCNPNNVDPACTDGICLFTEYVTNGGAAIASSRQNDGYHLMIMAAKNPSPTEEDYRKVVLHEVYHIYQLSHHTETDYDRAEEILGRLSGDHGDHVPWWMEGVAEYMAIMLYAQQPEAASDYAQQAFREKIGYYSSTSGAPVIDQYFALGIKLYNIKYDEHAMFGYSLGAWFVAYLMSEHSVQTLDDFYQNLDNATFADNFLSHFGQPYRDYVDEFEVFLLQPPEDLMAIIP